MQRAKDSVVPRIKTFPVLAVRMFISASFSLLLFHLMPLVWMEVYVPARLDTPLPPTNARKQKVDGLDLRCDGGGGGVLRTPAHSWGAEFRECQLTACGQRTLRGAVESASFPDIKPSVFTPAFEGRRAIEGP